MTSTFVIINLQIFCNVSMFALTAELVARFIPLKKKNALTLWPSKSSSRGKTTTNQWTTVGSVFKC